MCLYVKEIPFNKYSLVVKSYKWLDNYDGVLRTPWKDVIVPKNGLLINRKGVDKPLYNNHALYGEAVHAYSSKITRTNTYNSFSIGIIAYGDNNDVGSIALYIPICDKNKYRSKLLTKALTKISNRYKLKSDKTLILSYFPELEEKLKGF